MESVGPADLNLRSPARLIGILLLLGGGVVLLGGLLPYEVLRTSTGEHVFRRLLGFPDEATRERVTLLIAVLGPICVMTVAGAALLKAAEPVRWLSAAVVIGLLGCFGIAGESIASIGGDDRSPRVGFVVVLLGQLMVVAGGVMALIALRRKSHSTTTLSLPQAPSPK